MEMEMEIKSRTSRSRGLSFWSIIRNSLWITLTGILFFSLATTKAHTLIYIHFFTISGLSLITLPWIIQLLTSFTVIFLHKTQWSNLLWIVKSSSQKTNHTKVTTSASLSSPSPSPSPQVGAAEEIQIKIIIGGDSKKGPVENSSTAPLGMIMEIEGRNKTKLLTN